MNSILYIVAMAALVQTQQEADSSFYSYWEIFKKALSRNAVSEIKNLSLQTINCPACLSATHEKDSLLDKYREDHPKTWYNDLYSRLCFIEINKFLLEDYPLIVDSSLVKRIHQNDKIRFHVQKTDSKETGKEVPTTIFEVLITSIDPTNELEGMQKVFQFIRVKNKFKFYGYFTIP
jgi:hypothetical protein